MKHPLPRILALLSCLSLGSISASTLLAQTEASKTVPDSATTKHSAQESGAEGQAASTTSAAEASTEGESETAAPVIKDKKSTDADLQKKAAGWTDTLGLTDKEKAARVTTVIVTHLKAVRDWHNSHPFSSVPAGLNPATGHPLKDLDRQFIADSTLPKSVHEAVMKGLRAELTEEQVEAILDKYTVGKVAFTFKGYQGIVPTMTPADQAFIMEHLKKAREEAIDYKNMDLISNVFKIHKTQIEQYFDQSGRNWKQMYKAFSEKRKAEKQAKAKPAESSSK